MDGRKLRPCPFCGNPNVEIVCYPADGAQRFRTKYAVLCRYGNSGCGGESGHYASVREAVDAWNQRRRRWKE